MVSLVKVSSTTSTHNNAHLDQAQIKMSAYVNIPKFRYESNTIN